MRSVISLYNRQVLVGDNFFEIAIDNSITRAYIIDANYNLMPSLNIRPVSPKNMNKCFKQYLFFSSDSVVYREIISHRKTRIQRTLTLYY